jgi:hypothetical protein
VSSGALRGAGFAFPRGSEPLEADAKLLHRFLCDSGLSGGAWLHVPPAAAGGGVGGGGEGAGYAAVPPGQRVSTCDLEVAAPWASVHCLTPDATQLADDAWRPEARGFSWGGGAGTLRGRRVGRDGARLGSAARF